MSWSVPLTQESKPRWLPLSARNDPERAKDFDVLHDGIPGWLHQPLLDWIVAVALEEGLARYHGRAPRWTSQTKAHIQAALRETIDDFVEALAAEVYLDLIDLVLRLGTIDVSRRDGLEVLLSTGGSAWRVTERGLERRVDQTLERAAELVDAKGGRPAEHLRDAWHKAWGRNADASGAHQEAVSAVEAAYAPIVSPANPRTTLGTIISNIREKPSKFRVRLQASGADKDVGRVVAMMELLWISQIRHGTADQAAPISVSLDEARDAVALSTTLVHLAQQGGFTS